MLLFKISTLVLILTSSSTFTKVSTQNYPDSYDYEQYYSYDDSYKDDLYEYEDSVLKNEFTNSAETTSTPLATQNGSETAETTTQAQPVSDETKTENATSPSPIQRDSQNTTMSVATQPTQATASKEGRWMKNRANREAMQQQFNLTRKRLLQLWQRIRYLQNELNRSFLKQEQLQNKRPVS